MTWVNKHIVHTTLPMLLVIFLFTACNTMKYVPADDHLFTGFKVTDTGGKMDKSIKNELKKLARPQPNASLLGVKYKLIIYNAIKEPKSPKGILYKIKHKIGEAPVLLSSTKPKRTEKRMSDYLFNQGYFTPIVTNETVIKERTASIKFSVNAGTRYTIKNIVYPSDSSALTILLKKSAKESLLKKGQYIDLSILKTERERIDQYLKENGYFYFEPDFILFKVDSLHAGRADLYFNLKDDLPRQSLLPWKMGSISIYSNYKIERDSLLMQEIGKKEKRYTIIDKKETFKSSVFEKAVVLREGQVYNRALHNLTIERLMNLNTFRFVKTGFSPAPDSTSLLLNTKIYLSPAKKQSVRLELSANTKTTNFWGSELSLNYRNVNLFKGAEILEAKIVGGFDVQVGGRKSSANSYSLNAEVNLYVPKLMPAFFKIKTKRNPYIPRTVFTPALEYLRSPDLYTLRSVRFAMGYHFKKGKTIEHTLRLININSIAPGDITPKFDSILAQDVTLRASFEKQLIIGSLYQFQFNNTYRTDHSFNYAFDGIVSTSGNLASLLIPGKTDSTGAKKLFNIPLSQFVKLQADLRGYWDLSSKITFANRIIAGVALAYKNSSSVPYSEQFFIGGSSSIRAFRTRTLGPGSYKTSSKIYQSNESGEIKLELNSELRYHLNKYIKLAGFVDAGNIWLRKEAADKPGSGLEKGDLFKEMAVGGGIGVRFDASIMVLRFDVGMPLRKPWYPDGKRWVFNEIDFGNGSWRKDNLLLNIGIGYPF